MKLKLGRILVQYVITRERPLEDGGEKGTVFEWILSLYMTHVPAGLDLFSPEEVG